MHCSKLLGWGGSGGDVVAHYSFIKTTLNAAISWRSPTHQSNRTRGHRKPAKTLLKPVHSLMGWYARTHTHVNTRTKTQIAEVTKSEADEPSGRVYLRLWVTGNFLFSVLNFHAVIAARLAIALHIVCFFLFTKRKKENITQGFKKKKNMRVPPPSGCFRKNTRRYLWIPICELLEHVGIDAFVLLMLLLDTFLTETHLTEHNVQGHNCISGTTVFRFSLHWPDITNRRPLWLELNGIYEYFQTGPLRSASPSS